MPRGAGLSDEVTAISDQLRLASRGTVPLVRDRIDRLFGTILTRVSPDDVVVAEGARVLCLLYLYDLERQKGASTSALNTALRSLASLKRLELRPDGGSVAAD